MTALIVTLVLFAALFLFAFVTKRRFGVLGLALSAGALLSLHWTASLTPFLEAQGITLTRPALGEIVQIALILVPPIILLFSGPTYSKMAPRVFGALAFASLALIYTSDILANMLVLDQSSGSVYAFLHENKSTLIVAGILASVVDVLFTRKPRANRDGKKSGHH